MFFVIYKYNLLQDIAWRIQVLLWGCFVETVWYVVYYLYKQKRPADIS